MVKPTYLNREPVYTDADFVGRASEIAWLRDKLGRFNPQNCNIIGEPRSGKTSLLHTMYRQKIGLSPQEEGVYVWLQLTMLPQPTARAFWQTLLRQLHQEIGDLNVDLPPLTAEPAEPAALFNAVDVTLEALLSETAVRRIIFLIDDFDLLHKELTADDLDWLRALVTRYSDALAFVITSRDPIAKLTADVQTLSPFFNVFLDLWLGLLDQPTAEMLCHGAAAAEDAPPLSQADINFLLREAGRHPALLKIACVHFLEARRWSDPQTLLDDVRGDMRFDGQVQWLCRQLYERRQINEQEMLRCLATSQPVEPDAFLLRRLQHHLGLVETRNGKPALFADAFGYWVLQLVGSQTTPAGNGEGAGEPVADSTLNHQPEERLVRVAGKTKQLTLLENRLLTYFIAHAGSVCTAQDLLDNVWGPGRKPSVVEKGVNRLRAKIEVDPKKPRYILSARGEGYLFRPDG